MCRDKYTCCRCGAAAEYLEENAGALYCADCADEKAESRYIEESDGDTQADDWFYSQDTDDRIRLAGLVPLGDE